MRPMKASNVEDVRPSTALTLQDAQCNGSIISPMPDALDNLSAVITKGLNDSSKQFLAARGWMIEGCKLLK